MGNWLYFSGLLFRRGRVGNYRLKMGIMGTGDENVDATGVVRMVGGCAQGIDG